MKIDKSYWLARNCSASQGCGKALAYSSGFAEHFLKLGVVERAVDGGVDLFLGWGGGWSGQWGGLRGRTGWAGAPLTWDGGVGWPLAGRRCGGAVGAVGWKVGAMGRAVGAVVVTRCDRSRRAEWRGMIS